LFAGRPMPELQLRAAAPQGGTIPLIPIQKRD